MLFKQSRQRVTTSDLNRVVREALEPQSAAAVGNHRPRIYYGTQVSLDPPTIVLFCSEPAALDETYRRYLLNTFRESLPFGEVPIKLYLRKRVRGDQRDDLEPPGRPFPTPADRSESLS